MPNLPKRINTVSNCDLQIRDTSGIDILTCKYRSRAVKLQVLNIAKLSDSNINIIVNQYHSIASPSIIFSPHINAKLAKHLHANQVQYVDLSGNIYIESEQIYLFIRGEKPLQVKALSSSPFSVAGIKLIFTLLSKQSIEAMPYRTIAEYCNISLGSVETVFRNLIAANFLILAKNKSRRLINKIDLLNRWCILFSDKLQPKLILCRLTCEDKTWWKKLSLDSEHAVWGGEVAAAKLTKYLKPERITIFADNTLPNLQAKFALRKSDQGEIIIYKRFWNFKSQIDEELAPELLVYAELLNSGDTRNIETARIIYEKYISKNIK
jgi:hypothetical protein